MIKMKIICLATVLALLTYAGQGVPGQIDGAVVGTAVSKRSKFKFVNEAGWKVPVVTTKDLQKEFSGAIDGCTVTSKVYTVPQRRKETLLERLLTSGDDTVILQKSTVDIISVRSLSVGKTIYAWQVVYQPVAKNKSGNRAYYGPVLDYYYVDEDEDGVFETSYSYWRGEMDWLPEWVKNCEAKTLP